MTLSSVPSGSKPAGRVLRVTHEVSLVAEVTDCPCLARRCIARPSNRAPAAKAPGAMRLVAAQISGSHGKGEGEPHKLSPPTICFQHTHSHPDKKVAFCLYTSFLYRNYQSYSFHRFFPYPHSLATSLWLQEAL